MIVINDGSGSQCGYTYEQRLDIAKRNNSFEITRYLFMARKAYLSLVDKGQHLNDPRKLLVSALEIYDYYQQHIKEAI